MPGYPPTTAHTFRRRCDALMSIVERARTQPMEVWIQTDAAGRTLKERYAEVAALAFRLRDEIRRRSLDPTNPPAGDATADRDRRRRPVAVLLSEIDHCLGTVSGFLREAPQTALVPESMHELMERMEALLTPEPAPDPPAR